MRELAAIIRNANKLGRLWRGRFGEGRRWRWRWRRSFGLANSRFKPTKRRLIRKVVGRLPFNRWRLGNGGIRLNDWRWRGWWRWRWLGSRVLLFGLNRARRDHGRGRRRGLNRRMLMPAMLAIGAAHLPTGRTNSGVGNNITRVTRRTNQKHFAAINISAADKASLKANFAVERAVIEAIPVKLCHETYGK